MSTIIASILFLNIGGMANAQNKIVRCTVSSDKKTIRILASNNKPDVITCFKATCSGQTTAGFERVCDLKTVAPVIPGITDLEIGSCTDEATLIKSIKDAVYTCN